MQSLGKIEEKYVISTPNSKKILVVHQVSSFVEKYTKAIAPDFFCVC